jgi:NAD-dependent deacetylase
MEELDQAIRYEIERLAPVAAEANCIAVLTGAGVSAESGVPTFREAQTGLWTKYDPVMLASVDGFNRDPETVWKWYDERRQTIKTVEPNPGHYALAEWEANWHGIGRRFQLITQNIDDLHGKAGSREIIELHGNIWLVRPVEGRMDEAFRLDECPLKQRPPVDAEGRMLRPHVVWFGEMLDRLNIEAAFDIAGQCDLMFSIGTSSVVYPAAALPLTAKRAGVPVVEVNPQSTEFTPLADYVLAAPSGIALPALYKRICECLKR